VHPCLLRIGSSIGDPGTYVPVEEPSTASLTDIGLATAACCWQGAEVISFTPRARRVPRSAYLDHSGDLSASAITATLVGRVISAHAPKIAPHKVFCLWPHSLQAYSTRPWPTSLVTRLGAPHLLHVTSSRVWPRVMVTFRANASLTKRSDSWRIASFDIAGARGFRAINSPCATKPVSRLLFHRAQMLPSPSAFRATLANTLSVGWTSRVAKYQIARARWPRSSTLQENNETASLLNWRCSRTEEQP